MKNRSKYIVLGGIIVLGIVASLIFVFGRGSTKNEDAIAFKKEYEALNDESNENGSPKYTKLSISKDNKVVYLTYEELIEFINTGTGVLYFGRPACPWCRLLVPDMLEFAEENNINIYYYNIEHDRDENNSNYRSITNLLGEYLSVDKVTQKEEDPNFDESLKRVVLPHLFFLENGEVTGEIMLYQHEYLKNNENDKMKALLNSKLSSSCEKDNAC